MKRKCGVIKTLATLGLGGVLVAVLCDNKRSKNAKKACCGVDCIAKNLKQTFKSVAKCFHCI